MNTPLLSGIDAEGQREAWQATCTYPQLNPKPLLICRPIKMLRLVVATFFVVFYIGSLAIFMVALSCSWFDPNPAIRFHLKAFPEVRKS